MPSALLAVASIRCCSAFIAISPRAVSRAQRRHSVAGVEPGAHVIAAAASRSCSSNGRSRTRDQQRLSMQGSGMAEEVGTAGGDSLAETEEARWAEKQFPDCSTVVSKVGSFYYRVLCCTSFAYRCTSFHLLSHATR